ncbi:MAG: pilus assembly protein CpaF [Planctomycetes bacterium SM23_32]|nr:MAG: pilus assembly protein CpaF [Planctomycetes bacterium SM23_32]
MAQKPKEAQPKPRAKPKAEVEYTVQKQKVSLGREAYQDLKRKIHRKLLDALDLTILSELKEQEVKEQIRVVVARLLDQSAVTFNKRERDQFIQEMVDEVLGFGPLEPLLNDPTISDILVNGAKQVYVEQSGKLYLTDVEFKDDGHLRHVMDRIVSTVGRHIDESSPMCDARLPDGSRVNAIIPPLAVDYPVLSIRKFRTDALSMDDLLDYGTVTGEIAEVCGACVSARLNILISGGTGAGKTTMLNIMSGYIGHSERIVTIEDSAELQLQQPHVVRLETRPPNIEGKGEVTQYELLINSLRMRPDRIILGEVRGREALDMLQAMNTGHDGSMCTIHANSPRDALSRLETMVAMGGHDLPQAAVRQQISSALDVIVQVQRLPDGTRKLSYFTEVLGMEGEVVTMQDIFRYERKGVSSEGVSIGDHAATGVQPRFVDRLRATGIKLNPALFMPAR